MFLFNATYRGTRLVEPTTVHVKETVFAKFAEGIDCFGIQVEEASQIRTSLNTSISCGSVVVDAMSGPV